MDYPNDHDSRAVVRDAAPIPKLWSLRFWGHLPFILVDSNRCCVGDLHGDTTMVCKMTNEQINRAVAEELGWTNIRPRYAFGPALLGLEPRHKQECRVPDFCNDYNAVAEMRKAIKKDDEQVRFAQILCDMTFQGHEDIMLEYYWTLLNATPRQQCEAFLRMRGKWREG